MASELELFVQEIVRSTGAAAPRLLDDNQPVLDDHALSDSTFYLIGLIGGKEVGKSALVNALAGQMVTRSTSFGPGTQTVIAYVHIRQAAAIRELLEREVPGQFQIIEHRLDTLSRQVLLDLPDIDSHWVSHVEITRKMLRHILFPLWVQSIEKYADGQPQQLLATVAAGNTSDNFLFCLNKTDQLDRLKEEAAAAAAEIRDDFSHRIGKTLGVDPPRVWMLSAAQPQRFDLPELRLLLSQEKSQQSVVQSQLLARQQQDRSLRQWIDQQDLPGRAQRLSRLRQEAQELLDQRLAEPLLERALPALLDDPASRLALTDEVLGGRVSRWPVVNLVHTALSPVLAVVRRNVGVTRSASLPDAEALVDAHLRANGQPLARLVQNCFAQLQQMHPQLSQLYQQKRLWDDHAADVAAATLRTVLTDTISRQREAVRKRLGRGAGVFTAPLRWVLTVGALIWFPFVQPFLAALLQHNQAPLDVLHWTHEMTLLLVQIFSVSVLLQNLTFLSMYFFVLWLVLRWDTQRRVTRFMRRWRSDASDLSLTAQTVRWMDDLLRPINTAVEDATALASRSGNLESKSLMKLAG